MIFVHICVSIAIVALIIHFGIANTSAADSDLVILVDGANGSHNITNCTKNTRGQLLYATLNMALKEIHRQQQPDIWWDSISIQIGPGNYTSMRIPILTHL